MFGMSIPRHQKKTITKGTRFSHDPEINLLAVAPLATSTTISSTIKRPSFHEHPINNLYWQ
jgi:hypothetical protein